MRRHEQHYGKQRKVIEADEIRVGSLVISKVGDNGAGIWIGDGKDRPMIAIFSVDANQVGIGIYAKGADGPCAVALAVDEKGAGYIQLAKGDEVKEIGLDDFAECE